jgi:O-antigen ligase
VAAELGVVGIFSYLALLAAAVVLLRDALLRNRALGLALGAVFLALFVESLLYSGFFESPVTWGVLGLAAAVVGGDARLPAGGGLPRTLFSGDGASTASRARSGWHT